MLVVSQHQLQVEMSKTQKKIYVASSNATSSSRLFKSVGDSTCLEKQIMRCTLPRKRFTAVPFGEVNYFCIYAVDLAKDVLKAS